MAEAYPGCDILYDNRLRELGNNRADHSPFPDRNFVREFADIRPTAQPFTAGLLNHPNGETWMHFRARVGMFIEEIARAHRSQVVVVVCHDGVIEAAFNHIFNLGPWPPCEIWDHIHNTAVTYFELAQKLTGSTWQLHYHNRIGHLKGH